MNRTWIRSNQGVATAMTLVALAFGAHLLTSDWALDRLRGGFLLGAFTMVANLAILLCALSIMIDRQRYVVAADMATTTWHDWALAIAILLALFVYFQLAWEVDFLLVTPMVIAAATYGLGVRPLRSALLAGVAITVLVYVMFRLIGIELPTNIIGL